MCGLRKSTDEFDFTPIQDYFLFSMRTIARSAACAASLFFLFNSTLIAQEEEEFTAQDFDDITQDSQSNVYFQDPRNMPGFLGGNRESTTDRFDTSFNPAFAVVFDTLAEASSSTETASRFNNLRVRAFELNAASRIDPFGWAYATMTFADTGEESEVELEEAAAWFDQLPNNFSVRAGKYFADFGKWNTLHTHDKPFVHEDFVRRETFGGPLLTTGVEVHHWFGVGDVPVRWSLGLASNAEGEDHDAFGEEGHGHGEGSEFLRGRRGIDNWAATARVTAQHDVGDNGYFQWGVSGFHTPGALEFEEEPTPSGRVRELRFERRQTVFAADFTFRSVDAAGQTAHTISTELFHNRNEFGEEPIMSGEHNGIWGFYEYAFSPTCAIGAMGSWADHADSENSGFLEGGDTLAMRGAFITWWLSEFNRLRFQATNINPGFGAEKFWVFAVQWSVILGNHSHTVDW